MTEVPELPAAANARLIERVDAIRDAIGHAFIGQAEVLDQILVALLAGGHVLIEGVPGLGKTLLVRALAQALELDYGRVQFTPDLMPSDVSGHAVYDPKSESFKIRRGPVFTNLLLADEINRAPAKTQSALLEVMQEGQVTIEGKAFTLAPPFMALATQNPLEQEGTYPLPEAQLDRFLMHVRISYPDQAAESEILRLARERARGALGEAAPAPEKLPMQDVFDARREVLDLHMAPALERYLIELVLASREPSRYDAGLGRRIAWGASPRGSIALERCARARAWLAGRDFVTPDDVRAVAADVLRHRVLPSYEATAEGWDGERLVQELLARVPAP